MRVLWAQLALGRSGSVPGAHESDVPYSSKHVEQTASLPHKIPLPFNSCSVQPGWRSHCWARSADSLLPPLDFVGREMMVDPPLPSTWTRKWGWRYWMGWDSPLTLWPVAHCSAVTTWVAGWNGEETPNCCCSVGIQLPRLVVSFQMGAFVFPIHCFHIWEKIPTIAAPVRDGQTHFPFSMLIAALALYEILE